MKENLEYRMYVLVLRQLNAINKGIQAAHACMEYALQYGNAQDYKKYMEEDKTLIILDGGTSNDLIDIDKLLYENNIKYAKFIEPDINNTITAICFLADERVFDRENYPMTCDEYIQKNTIPFCGIISENMGSNYHNSPTRNEYLNLIGGEKNLLLKDIIKDKRLSM